MTNPSVAPIIEVTLGGETRVLKYGFRAFKELGVNPFQPQTMIAYLSGENLDVNHAAAWVRAGMLHEYAKGGVREGQEPPTVDEVIDMLDVPSFMALVSDGLEASGLKGDSEDPKPEAPKDADPPKA